MSLLEVNSISTASTFAQASDATSRIGFDLAAIPTATTRTYAWPNVNSQVVCLSSTDTLTNKTITDASNNVAARALWYGSGAGSVSTYAAAAPTSGQVLIASGATNAAWSTLAPSALPFAILAVTLNADQNDYAPGITGVVQLQVNVTGTARTITGLAIVGTSSVPLVNELKITNVGTFNLILRHESVLSVASNRFAFDGADVVLLPGQNATVWYEWTTARWRGVVQAWGRTGGQIAQAGTLTPAIINVDTNDYAPTGIENTSVLRLASSAAVNVTGLTGGYNGRMITIVNVGANSITLVNQSALSLAANRFFTGTSDTTLVGNNTATLLYDGVSTTWRVTAGTGGGSTGVGGLIQSQWVEVFDDRSTTLTTWPVYNRTINAAGTLPQGTITVATTTGAYAASPANPQTVSIQTTNNGAQIVTYTGTTGTTFTGCTGGSGAIAVGCYISNGPRQTTIAAGSNGVALPAGTINCVSTTGFPSSGRLLVNTSTNTNIIAYTGTTATTFTGCTGGTGTMSTGGRIADVTATNNDLLRIELSTSGGPLIIISTICATVSHNQTGFFQIVVDGYTQRGGAARSNGGAPAGSTVVSLKINNLVAGDHVVVFRWRVGGGTMSMRPVTSADNNNASMLVQEVSS